MGEWFTPPQIARSRGIRSAKVLGWIRSGELEAVDLSSRRGGRPRWHISAEALAAFDRGRSNRIHVRAPRPPPARRAEGITQFF